MNLIQSPLLVADLFDEIDLDDGPLEDTNDWSSHDTPTTLVNPFNMRPRGSTAKHWAFTWNNYPPNATETLTGAFEGFVGCIAWVYQHEIGVEETPHIQGAVKFSRRVRWSQLELPDAIHWEACRGSWQSNVDYCSKEESRDLTKGMPVMHNCAAIEALDIQSLDSFYPWQTKAYNLLTGQVDKRAIYWIWETEGNTGKSTFVKHMVAKQDAIYCAGGRTNDITNLVYNAWVAKKPIKIILWDLPRVARGALSFNAVESLKNGLISNMKYETGTAIFNSPHIMILSNYLPVSLDDISQDRWHIHEIVDKDILSL